MAARSAGTDKIEEITSVSIYTLSQKRTPVTLWHNVINTAFNSNIFYTHNA